MPENNLKNPWEKMQMSENNLKSILGKMQQNVKANPMFKSEIPSEEQFPANAETQIVSEDSKIWSIDTLSYLNKINRRNFNLRYCKFLDVNSPKISNGLSVGVDLYLPRFNEKFFEAFCKVNANEDEGISFEMIKEGNYINIREKSFGLDWIMYDTKIENLVVCHNCTIPSGIGIDIPAGYFMDLRPRSGCHKNEYTLILGTIDEDYTYGFGFQILLYDKFVVFEKDIRIGQFLLIKGELINNMTEIPESEWNNDAVIMKKRETRTGGFGSTGKK